LLDRKQDPQDLEMRFGAAALLTVTYVTKMVFLFVVLVGDIASR